MAEPPATALSVPITDSMRECVDLSEGAALALTLPLEDTMLELLAHEEPELPVRAASLTCVFPGVPPRESCACRRFCSD